MAEVSAVVDEKRPEEEVACVAESEVEFLSASLQENTGKEEIMQCSDQNKGNGKATLQLECHTQVDGNYRERGKQII